MAKARKSSVEVSLFPFLSILACTIGILVMILCSVIISQIEPEGIKKVEKEKTENNKRIKKLDELELQKRELLKKLKEFERVLTTDVDFAGKIKSVQAEVAKKQKIEKALLKKKIKVKTLDDALAVKMRQKDELLASIEKKKEFNKRLLAALKKERERIHKRLRIVSTGGGSVGGVEATYVECSDKGLTIIGDQSIAVSKGTLLKNKEWQSLLKQNSGKSKKTLVFLLRPSVKAIESYYEAKKLLDKYYPYVDNAVNSSKIPLVSYAPIAVGGK